MPQPLTEASKEILCVNYIAAYAVIGEEMDMKQAKQAINNLGKKPAINVSIFEICVDLWLPICVAYSHLPNRPRQRNALQT